MGLDGIIDDLQRDPRTGNFNLCNFTFRNFIAIASLFASRRLFASAQLFPFQLYEAFLQYHYYSFYCNIP